MSVLLIRSLFDRSICFKPDTNAKSISSWANREETISSLSGVSLKSVLRGTWDPYYNRRFVARIADVKLEDVMDLAKRLLPAFLDADLTQTAIVCGPSEVEDIVTSFRGHGIDLRVLDENLGEDPLFA